MGDVVAARGSCCNSDWRLRDFQRPEPLEARPSCAGLCYRCVELGLGRAQASSEKEGKGQNANKGDDHGTTDGGSDNNPDFRSWFLGDDGR